MAKKIDSSEASKYGQLSLDGKTTESYRDEPLDILKSALQKSIRRCDVEKSMWFALKLAEKNPPSCWRRLNIIAVEDCLDATVILAVSELGRQTVKHGFDTWDGKMCAVAAAFLMASCKKNRIADEFLELYEMMDKYPNDEELVKKKAELSRIEDCVLDMHTRAGRALGRGEQHWIETSSETVNKTLEYEAWREHFWKPLMLRLTKEE